MAFWCRIRQSNLKSFSNQFKRCYFQIPGLCSVNHTAEYTKFCVLDKPYWVIRKNQIEFHNNVRFFAAPVQANPKKEEKDTSGPRLNEKIKAEFVRLVTDEGHGIVSRREALERAKRLRLDLVEVQRTAKPPVCKLMDYGKEKYLQQLKDKERAKSKSDVTLRKGSCKEVRFTIKIEQKDLQQKADIVKRLMERGYRVKCTAMGTGEDQDLGGLLSRFSTLIEDFSIVESGPLVEKRKAYSIVRHVKYGPPKKGLGKKASKVEVTSNVVQNSNQSPLKFEGNLDPADSGLESEDDFHSEQIEASISPELDSTTTDEVPSSPFVASQGTENRYKSGPRNRSPPRTPMDFRGPGVRDSVRQPKFDLNIPSPTREPKRVETDASLFRNSKFPADTIPKQEASHPSAPSSPKSYGLFSSPKASDTPRQQGVPAEVNRYKGGNPFKRSA